MYKNTVKYTVYAVKRVLLSYQERCYKCVEGIFSHSLTCTKKLNASPHLPCVLHVLWCDPGNSFCVNILKIQEFSICQGGKNGNLAACILSFHVSSGYQPSATTISETFRPGLRRQVKSIAQKLENTSRLRPR